MATDSQSAFSTHFIHWAMSYRHINTLNMFIQDLFIGLGNLTRTGHWRDICEGCLDPTDDNNNNNKQQVTCTDEWYEESWGEVHAGILSSPCASCSAEFWPEDSSGQAVQGHEQRTGSPPSSETLLPPSDFQMAMADLESAQNPPAPPKFQSPWPARRVLNTWRDSSIK